jgi:hypothetical protein
MKTEKGRNESSRISAFSVSAFSVNTSRLMPRASRLLGVGVFLICLAVVISGCDAINSLTATKIKDILDHPRDYENKEVTIYGTVTNAASLLVVKYFEIEDGTGTMRVVTDRLLPAKGEKLKVTGRMEVFEMGADRLVVLRETSKAEQAEKSG